MRTFETDDNIALINQHLNGFTVGYEFTVQHLKELAQLEPDTRWIGRTLSDQAALTRTVRWVRKDKNGHKVFKVIK